MAELADALDSGSSGGNPVEVRVLFSASFVSIHFRTAIGSRHGFPVVGCRNSHSGLDHPNSASVALLSPTLLRQVASRCFRIAIEWCHLQVRGIEQLSGMSHRLGDVLRVFQCEFDRQAATVFV